MAPIDWDGFTWEAFATLATGVTAVGAALIVGLRQVGIANQQRAILDRQVMLDEMKLRADLFDRRFKIYEATIRLIAAVVSKAAQADHELERAFTQALDQSKLLFRPDVHKKLDSIWNDYCELCLTIDTMAANFQSTGAYGAAEIQNKVRLLTAFAELIQNLTPIFGDELKLSEH